MKQSGSSWRGTPQYVLRPRTAGYDRKEKSQTSPKNAHLPVHLKWTFPIGLKLFTIDFLPFARHLWAMQPFGACSLGTVPPCRSGGALARIWNAIGGSRVVSGYLCRPKNTGLVCRWPIGQADAAQAVFCGGSVRVHSGAQNGPYRYFPLGAKWPIPMV